MRLCLILLGSVVVWAQQPVAPTNEPTQSARGNDLAGYNVLQSFELGYRWVTTGGDRDMYRSTVNYGNGIRLLSNSLSVQSKDGHGKFFDQIVLSTQGLGNDPYQNASLRVEKNGLYRYDLMWRSNAFFNPTVPISNGLHKIDSERRMQDQDLTLFPQSNLRFFLGYSRDTQSGPALTTVQLYDARGDEYPLFENLKREQNEYRLGGEAKVAGFRLNVLRGWTDYKEESPISRTTVSQGANTDDFNQLNLLTRTEPYHGTSPYWRGSLMREGRRWSVSGRASYVAGRRAYAVNESSAGTNRSGNDVFRQVTSVGNAQRPTAAGSLTINLFPTRTLTIVNHTAASHVRMLGNSYLLQVDRGNDPIVSLPYQFLGIRLVANATDAEYRAKSWLTLHGGYEYSERRIRSQESYGVVPGLIEQSNRLHTATAGLRWRPAKNLTFIADGEVGRADHPIYPISDRNFQAGRARLEYKTKPWRASVFMKLDYNTNSASISNYASQNKQWGADGSWNPRSWFSLDATYAKLSLRTLGALSYFVSPPIQNVTSTTSLYISRVHTATLAAHVSLVKRVDLAIGMSHVQDVGDGRASLPSNPFVAAQTFPLRYTSPMARLSYRITDKIRWNAGYQYYGYAEQFFLKQNYRANTGYSSLSWSF